MADADKDDWWKGLYLYGGSDGACDAFDDPGNNPWASLKIIQKKLADGKPLPHDYAKWLGEAIRLSDEDPDKFSSLLGIKKKQGKPSSFPPDAWLQYGQLIHARMAQGMSPEEAIDNVLDEYLDNPPDRRTLQRWRDRYRAAVEAEVEVEWGDQAVT
ncbi:MAG: hypothetical protein M1492_06960 [Gammaproteobacteria bacterium]|nr:hypothetical protein [Gammaproteobacteria bacterium]